MNDHDEPLDPLAPADAEETHAANALREALEARAGGAEAPSGALEAAALLRSGGPAGRLSDERRAALRSQLLTDLEAARVRRGGTQVTARAGLRRWFTLLLPLTGGAAALIIFALFRWQGSEESAMSAAPTTSAAFPEGRLGEVQGAAHSLATRSPQMALREAPGEAAPPSEAKQNADSPARRMTAQAPSGPIGETRADGPSTDMRAEAERSGIRVRESLADADRAPAAAAPSVRGIGSFASSAGSGTGSAANAQPATPAAQPAKPLGERSPARAAASASVSRAQVVPSDLDARLALEARKRRVTLLPRLRDPRVNAAYAALDRAHSPPELRAAQSQLLTLTAGALGAEGVAAADGSLARQDIFCRLAETALQLGQPGPALAWARQGLELDTVPNVFGARLHALAGQARAALGDRDGAAESYSKAIEIDEQLLDESLDGAP